MTIKLQVPSLLLPFAREEFKDLIASGEVEIIESVELCPLVERLSVPLGPDFHRLPRKSKGEKKRAAAAMRRKGWK